MIKPRKIKQALLVSAFAVALFSVPASAQLFGPSDEEKAHEASQDQQLGDLTSQARQQADRIRDLEDKVRGLTSSLSQSTGTNEELQHQIQVQNDKIDRMQKDFAYRLCTLSAQQLGAGDSMNCAAAGTGTSVAPQPYSQSGLRPGDQLPPIDATGNNGGGGFTSAPPAPSAGRGRPPGNLGTLPMNSGPMNPGPMNSGPMNSGPSTGAPAQLNGSYAGNTGQYDSAMNLMAKAQYSEASAAFRAYADANPDDTDLSPQAIYWVANMSFIHQDYAPAARTFAEVIKKYPKSQRAPDAMLKLAQSFMGMGQKTEGCTTLGLIKSKYPNASPSTLGQAANLRKTACTK
jgi:tol-pal system protein YbgF